MTADSRSRRTTAGSRWPKIMGPHEPTNRCTVSVGVADARAPRRFRRSAASRRRRPRAYRRVDAAANARHCAPKTARRSVACARSLCASLKPRGRFACKHAHERLFVRKRQKLLQCSMRSTIRARVERAARTQKSEPRTPLSSSRSRCAAGGPHRQEQGHRLYATCYQHMWTI